MEQMKNDESNKTLEGYDQVVKAEIDGREIEVGINEEGANVLTDLSDMDEGQRNDLLQKVATDKKVVELSKTLAKVKQERFKQNKKLQEIEEKERLLKQKEEELKRMEEELKKVEVPTNVDFDVVYEQELAKALNVTTEELADKIDELIDGDAKDKMLLEKARAKAQSKVATLTTSSLQKKLVEQARQEVLKQSLGEEYSKIVAFQKQYGITSFEKAKVLYAQMNKNSDLGNGIDKISDITTQAPVFYRPTRRTETNPDPAKQKVSRLSELSKFYG